MPPNEGELATQALQEEALYRFPSFDADAAVMLGLSIRKRFRSSSRHVKVRGMIISIQTIAGHTLFSCTVGNLGGVDGAGDVSLDSWACLEGMIAVVRKTGHSSYYVEKGMNAMGKTPRQMGIQGEYKINGGAFPIWLENAPCCPIAVVACYSGSSQDDHHMVVTAVRDYLKKLARDSAILPPSTMGASAPSMPMPMAPQSTGPGRPPSTVGRRHLNSRSLDRTYKASQEWMADPASRGLHDHDEYDRHEEYRD
ncbi:hypothetical protein C2E23DRAFT_736179 [Lenzites betulinus]|nr:hypothetical protein C2E23DRAFT_736179 [Lenzites betulinus]